MTEPGRGVEDVSFALGHCRSLVDDWPAFVEASRRPLVPVLWAHPGRIDAEALARVLGAAEPIGWAPGSFRWPVERPGRHWAHAAGLYYVQEEASQLPVRMLDLRPGHRVLDLCAAPGGKTMRMALAVGTRGMVVANDRKPGRQVATAAAMARLGLNNVVITAQDGTRFEDGPEGGGFDRVLVDAPCTAEGNLSGRLRRRPVEPSYRRFITEVQKALLRRAVQLCRPGGRVVYSTCTYAPEENEAVVEAVLGEGGMTNPSPELAGLRWMPVVAGHGVHAARLWPHVAGTGGFFAAALDKAGRLPPPPCAPPPVQNERWARVADRYGLPRELSLRTPGGASWWMETGHPLPLGPIISAGLCLQRRPERSNKLTTEGAMALGRRASRRMVELRPEQVVPYQSRQSVALAPEQCEGAEGQVIVRHGVHALGMGTLRGGRLESDFPKAWAWDRERPPPAA